MSSRNLNHNANNDNQSTSLKKKKSVSIMEQSSDPGATARLILEKDMPTAIEHLNARCEEFHEAAAHFGNEYINSARIGSRNPSEVVLEMKKFLAQGLVTLTEDLNAIVTQLDSAITSQDRSIESLAEYTTLVHSKLQFVHHQQNAVHFDEMKLSAPKKIWQPNELTEETIPINETL
eukprot:gene9829-10876_t